MMTHRSCGLVVAVVDDVVGLLLPVGRNCYAVPDSADGRLSGIAR